MYTRERNGFSPLPSTKVAHSPLPVLPIFELNGSIRHSGAIMPESWIKKNQLLTTSALPDWKGTIGLVIV